jgi:hypothetical protein
VNGCGSLFTVGDNSSGGGVGKSLGCDSTVHSDSVGPNEHPSSLGSTVHMCNQI